MYRKTDLNSLNSSLEAKNNTMSYKHPSYNFDYALNVTILLITLFNYDSLTF